VVVRWGSVNIYTEPLTF